MAAPSLSIPVPDPRNSDKSRDSQSVTPAKAGVHVEAGLDSGFRRNDGGCLNRRSLLIGGTALAAAAPVVAFGHPHPPASRVPPSPLEGEGWGEGAKKQDPALIAYEQVRKIDRVLWRTVADEDDPYYLALLAAYDRAEAAFADARATSPAGIRAKLNHVAYLYAPDAEGEMCRSSLATSIVADFARVMAG